LTPVPLLPGRPVFWPLCPASRRNPGRDASCPVFSVTPCWVHEIYSLEWKCVVFCTITGVNFLAESASESRNLHLNCQEFSGVTPRTGPQLREVATLSRTNLRTTISWWQYMSESVTRGQCSTRPTVTFPAKEHRHSPWRVLIFIQLG